MRRRAAAGFFGVMALLAVSALALRRWEVALASLPAFLFFGSALLASPAGAPALLVERKVEPDMIPAGGTADITVEVTNPADRATGLFESLDELLPSMEVTRGVPRHLFTLGPHETKLFRYTVKPHALGEISIGPLKVRHRDALHFTFEEASVGEAGRLTVRRAGQDARKFQPLPSAIRRPLGQVPSRSKGAGTEFFGLRDYVSGDPFRAMSWKASARLDRLISKECEDERTGDVVLLVDLRPGVRIGTGTGNTHDAAVSGARALAERVLHTRNRLTLVVVRSDVGVLPGIVSRRHLTSMLGRDEIPEMPLSYPIVQLSWLLRRALPAGAQVVAFTPLTDDFMLPLLEETASNGSRVLVICPVPYSADAALPLLSPANVTRHLLEFRRMNRVLRLRRTMVVAEWDHTRPLASPLGELSRREGGGLWRFPAAARRTAR